MSYSLLLGEAVPQSDVALREPLVQVGPDQVDPSSAPEWLQTLPAQAHD